MKVLSLLLAAAALVVSTAANAQTFENKGCRSYTDKSSVLARIFRGSEFELNTIGATIKRLDPTRTSSGNPIVNLENVGTSIEMLKESITPGSYKTSIKICRQGLGCVTIDKNSLKQAGLSESENSYYLPESIPQLNIAQFSVFFGNSVNIQMIIRDQFQLARHVTLACYDYSPDGKFY